VTHTDLLTLDSLLKRFDDACGPFSRSEQRAVDLTLSLVGERALCASVGSVCAYHRDSPGWDACSEDFEGVCEAASTVRTSTAPIVGAFGYVLGTVIDTERRENPPVTVVRDAPGVSH
jgi:hypothetical protein